MRSYTAAACLALIALSACDSFLEVEPETAITPTNFYTTQEDFEQAVGAIYQPLIPIYDNAWQMSELRSDNTHFMYDVANRGSKPIEDLGTFLVETNNATVASRWEENYQIITRANQVLERIGDASLDEGVKDNLQGQAYFLRALAYFDLVRNFGGVPLFLESPTSYEETFKQRATAEAIFDQVIADAEAAATLLPGREDQDPGKATSGAAYTLLGDVYVWLERWGDAEAALKQVTGYSLLPNYMDVFRPSNEHNEEMIFEVGFLGATSQNVGSTFPYDFLPVLGDPSVITGVSPASQNDNGSFNTPTPDIIAAYDDKVNDERYAANIAYHTGPSPLVGITYDETPYINKYQHPHAACCTTDQNWPVYRYAEVLLLLAEAINEQGRPAEAYLNEVRERAGLDPVSPSGQAEMRDLIMHERRLELAFENKRWYDLVRTDQAVSVMTAFGERVKNDPQAYYYPEGSFSFPGSFMVTEDDYRFPIPVGEITINPDLAQNPGY